MRVKIKVKKSKFCKPSAACRIEVSRQNCSLPPPPKGRSTAALGVEAAVNFFVLPFVRIGIMRFRSRSARLGSRSLFSPARLLSVVLPVIMLLAIMIPQAAWAQEGPLDKSGPKGITVDEIIKRFAAKEKEFKEARDQYTYRQDVKVMTLEGDTPDGMYQQVFDVTFDDKGKKIKNVVFAPQPTLQRIQMTSEDFDDIENRLPFV